MNHLNDIYMQLSQFTNLDKSTWFALGYACYLYIIMDGMTRSSSRRRRNYRHY